MILLIALLPVTALTIAGYVVLFLSNRSDGALRTFGKYLGFWAFTLAGLVFLGALFAAARMGRYGGPMGMRGMHGHMYGGWAGDSRYWGPREEERRGADDSGAAAPEAAPANPASPPNAKVPGNAVSPGSHSP
jgi:hypothetical protein